MFFTLKSLSNKKIIPLLMGIFLFSNILSLTGCATMGAKLATHIAEKEERKDCSDTYPGDGPGVVDQKTCEWIARLIQTKVKEAFVAYDKSGRLKLKGVYENEDEVNFAYMVAVSLVGTNGMAISPVTPKKLKEIKLIKSYIPQEDSTGKGEKYALLIGVSKFESNKITDIETAVKDVNLLRESLKSRGFKKDNIHVLTDNKATKEKILDEMRLLESKVTSRDSVVFYISTHGTPPDTYGKMGIFPYDMKIEILNSKNRHGEITTVQEQIKKIMDEIEINGETETSNNKIIEIVNKRLATLKTAISFDDIQDFITSVKTDKFITILDTCYSGSALPTFTPLFKKFADHEKNALKSLGIERKSDLLGGSRVQSCEMSEYPDSQTRKIITASGDRINSSGVKGMFSDESIGERRSILPVTQTIVDNDFMFDDLELKKVVMTNGIPKQGKVLVTATNGDEESLFDDPKKFNLNREMLPNSFFTFYLAKGLDKFNGQIFKAFDYAKVRASRLVARDYPGKTQTPEMIGVPKSCINIDLSK